ncbi:MAG TPA: phytanoyl-CoA dioxygenase family protein [Chthoniobacterales bacterium]|jgi:Protein involved in biosynthesis of mitomycin antibiotics/polyketide fumonisin|nr:phytanoyl-CoA dioxygenase family protein [Chthoniobacterales bacterium]
MSREDTKSIENKTTDEQTNSFFSELPVDLARIDKPRVEKFPEAGPLPWLDRPDAESEIAKRLSNGAIDPAEADQLRNWIKNGYLILDRAIESDLLDQVWAAYQKAIDDGTIGILPEKIGPDDPWPGRCLDPHLKVPEICQIMRHATLLRWIRLLMDRPPAPFQTITCHKGSQQGAHSDSIHMTTYPLGYLTACWIAFEDIHPDSGPLVYYPGSHRLPYLFSRDLGLDENNFREHGYKGYTELYEPRIQEIIREQQLAPHHFLAKKGDVLIWHANLLHGGSLRHTPRLSRKALVCHYFVEGAVCYHDLSANVARPFSGTCLVEQGEQQR